MKFWEFTAVLILQMSPSTPAPCVWPKWFDLSDLGTIILSKHEQRSWETNTKIKNMSMSLFRKSRTLIEIETNKTMFFVIGKFSDDDPYIECIQDLGNSKYIVKSMYKKPSEYRCIQLIQRSTFVAQWKFGPKSSIPLTRCDGDFAPVSEWPLVYLPTRDQLANDKIKYQQLLDYYPGCPSLGAFFIKLYKPNGETVEGCENNFPLPLLSIGCIEGESITILTNCDKLRTYYPGGAKLHCLGNWEDEEYRYSVLVPTGDLLIQVFYCLRMNKTDPTKGEALLFLDNVCRKGNPEPSDNYLRMKLQRRSVSRDMCDDISNQCDQRKCSNKPYWCAKTCGHCPGNVSPSSVSTEIRGKWFRQIKGKQDNYVISEKTMALSGMGTFTIYGNISQEKEVCLYNQYVFKKDSVGYILGKVGDAEGCGGHVVQLKARKISNSVLILQNTGPAPLRPGSYIADTTKWCHNNFLDVDKCYNVLFSPYWPTMAKSGLMSIPKGYFLLVKKDKQIRTKCYSDKHGLQRMSHMKVDVKYYLKNSENRYVENHCAGEIHVEGKMEDQYRITYKCRSARPVTITYDCLGIYKMDYSYYALILKTDHEPTTDNEVLPTDDVYYCLMLLTESDSDEYPFYYTTAGNCDPDYILGGSLTFRPDATMQMVEYITPSTVAYIPETTVEYTTEITDESYTVLGSTSEALLPGQCHFFIMISLLSSVCII